VNERAGTELSAVARQVISESRGADDPTAEDEARVKARWLAGIAAGAGVSSLSEAVRAAASTGWGLKAGALIAALAVATAGVYLGWPQLSESKRVAPASSVASQATPNPSTAAPPASATPLAVAPTQVPTLAAPAEPAPAEPTPAEPTPSGADTAAPELPSTAAESQVAAAEAQTAAPQKAPRVKTASSRTATRARSVSLRRAVPEKVPSPPVEQAAPATAAALSGQLGEEIALLSEIRNNLQSGAPARALEQLTDYRQRFGQPSLAMEADALQVDALCRAGQREAARAAASAFSSRWPSSPLQQRVSAACP
jgi:hypothetical protein